MISEDKKVKDISEKGINGKHILIIIIALLVSVFIRFKVINANIYSKEDYNKAQSEYAELVKSKESMELELNNLENIKNQLETYIK